MSELNDLLIGCGISTVVGAAIDFSAMFLVSSDWQTVIMGSPRWSWLMGSIAQFFVFPTLLFLELYSTPLPIEAWLSSPMKEATVWRYVWYYTIWGYWAKDFVTGQIPKLVFLHHVACLSVLGCTLTEVLEATSGYLCLGATLLEVGSLANSLMMQCPSSVLINEASAVVMALSNIASEALLLWWAFHGNVTTTGEIAGRVTVCLIGTVLMTVRQLEMIGTIKKARLRWHEKGA